MGPQGAAELCQGVKGGARLGAAGGKGLGLTWGQRGRQEGWGRGDGGGGGCPGWRHRAGGDSFDEGGGLWVPRGEGGRRAEWGAQASPQPTRQARA